MKRDMDINAMTTLVTAAVVIILSVVFYVNRITPEAVTERFQMISQAEKVEIVHMTSLSVPPLGDPWHVVVELRIDNRFATGECFTNKFLGGMACTYRPPGSDQN